MLVSIILPTIRAGTLADAIEAILRQTDDNWELIVVPQGDEAAMLRMLDGYRDRDPRIRYVHTPKKNLSHARNVGMPSALGEIIAFTDDDCEVAPDWIAVMRELFIQNPDIHYLGGEVVAQPNAQPWRISTCPAAHVINAKYFPLRDNWRAPAGFYMIGANISLRREIAEKVGPFDDVFGAGAQFGSCEDQDFGLRAEALGIGFMTSKRLVVNHTTGRRVGFRSFVKHQRAYARGRGAWLAKLRLWGHPVVPLFEAKPSLMGQAKGSVTRPDKWLLGIFGKYHAKRAEAEYLAQYVLGDDLLSIPRKPPTHPVAVALRSRQMGDSGPVAPDAI
ncbi:MAG: glycosyltransferase family 2 protein [Gemmatimonadaceae bacterium]|nr:glycosyltransferase family 2 protein [Gemmatimonadaceae bacterium]